MPAGGFYRTSPRDIGLVVEISFQDQRYEENTRQIELRPVIQKNVRRYQFDFNPVFERGWRGQGTSDSWVFEPNLRLGYELSPKLDASTEYYGTPAFQPRLRANAVGKPVGGEVSAGT